MDRKKVVIFAEFWFCRVTAHSLFWWTSINAGTLLIYAQHRALEAWSPWGIGELAILLGHVTAVFHTLFSVPEKIKALRD